MDLLPEALREVEEPGEPITDEAPALESDPEVRPVRTRRTSRRQAESTSVAELEVEVPQPDLRPQPKLDMDFVRAEIAAGRTPTCPDCGVALTKVPRPGARLPRDFERPDPEDHRCNPDRLARLVRARVSITRPGETPAEARRRKAAITETYIRPAPEEAELF